MPVPYPLVIFGSLMLYLHGLFQSPAKKESTKNRRLTFPGTMHKIIPSFIMKSSTWIIWSLIISSRQERNYGPQKQSNGFLVEFFSLWIRRKAMMLITPWTEASGSAHTSRSFDWRRSALHRTDLAERTDNRIIICLTLP